MFYVYVLISEVDKQFYTGATSDLKLRMQKHQEGRVISTKNRRPFKLVYYEACLSKTDAFMREKYLKTGMAKIFT
jgi:putative endonuclease